MMSRIAREYHYLSHDYPLAIAHRGGAGDWPENSLSAFEGSYRLGFRYMETDVHLTRDGQVVAFHDATLDRLEGSKLPIRALSWDQIRALRLMDNARVPRMSDLFEALPDACFNIDMKCNEVVEPLIRLVKQHNAEQRVCLASFNDRRIRQIINAFGDSVCVSTGRVAVARQVARCRGLPCRAVEQPVLQVPMRRMGVDVVTKSFVNRCHLDGKHVHVWTINDIQQMSQLLDWGVDGIVTDYPARLRDVLVDKGMWNT